MSAFEALTLDGLALHTGGLSILSLSMPPPPGVAEWIKGADSNGALLSRVPTHDNRVIEARIGVDQTATRDLALAKIATLIDKLQECAQNDNGLGLTWVPSDSVLAALTFRCLHGEITDLPIDWESGWLARAPSFTIRLTCLPFGEGTEYLAGSVTSSDIMPTLTLTAVPGDVPALGRLVITDAATQSRRWLAWGMESRWLPTSGAPSLVIDSTSMVTSGFAGVTATRSGAYSGASNNVISATLRTQVQAICGLGNLSHVGSFRPQLRYYASDLTMAVRLTYQTLDGPFRSLSYNVPVAIGFNHLDLGLITIPATKLGTQRWTGRIEAYSTGTGAETFQVDAVCMVPAEQFGRARGRYAYSAGVLTAYDDFTGRTAGAAISAASAPVGGAWTSSGAGADFAASDGPVTGNETVSRSATFDAGYGETATLATVNTSTEVGVDIYMNAAAFAAQGLVARWTDVNNTVNAYVQGYNPNGGLAVVNLEVRVGGFVVHNDFGNASSALWGEWYRLRLVVYASGLVVLHVLSLSGAIIDTRSIFHSSLATGGSLASGKAGIMDANTGGTAATRYYDHFYVATPAAEPIVLHSAQSIEMRHDTVLREDSTGTYAGPPLEYVGGRFFVAPAGVAARSTRIAVMAKRWDVESTADDNIADSTTVQAYVKPRFLVVPRA